MDEIILEDGKYRFYRIKDGRLYCTRYGEDWRDFTGDKAVYALFDACLKVKKIIPCLQKIKNIFK